MSALPVIETRTEIRCPQCGRLQMVVLGDGSGVVERMCDKCSQILIIDLSSAKPCVRMDNAVASRN